MTGLVEGARDSRANLDRFPSERKRGATDFPGPREGLRLAQPREFATHAVAEPKCVSMCSYLSWNGEASMTAPALLMLFFFMSGIGFLMASHNAILRAIGNANSQLPPGERIRVIDLTNRYYDVRRKLLGCEGAAQLLFTAHVLSGIGMVSFFLSMAVFLPRLQSLHQ